jgi:uncharacterized protein
VITLSRPPRRSQAAPRAAAACAGSIAVLRSLSGDDSPTTTGGKAVPYAIITRDKPNSLHLRNEARAEHLDYLTRNQDKLLAAGAQVDDEGQGGYGGIIIVDTEDRAEAEAFIRDDPFTKAGLFAGTEVVRWRKAFFDKKRLI